MTVQGTGSAATTSVAIPTHAAGDLIFVITRNAATTVPTTPTASGTVPAWTVAQTGTANTISLISAWFIATAANHTTGTWTGASHICVLVLRPGAGNTLNVAGSSTGNAASSTTTIFPALTLTTLAGTSWGVRTCTRGTATTMSTVPSGWTNQVVQPAGSSAVMAVHNRASLVANPTADSVSGTFLTASRAHTIEVSEQPIAAVGQQPMAMII